MDDQFWDMWAIRHARYAWSVHRGSTQPPPVKSVARNMEEAVFDVTFEGGEVFAVEVSGMGRVKLRPPVSA